MALNTVIMASTPDIAVLRDTIPSVFKEVALKRPSSTAIISSRSTDANFNIRKYYYSSDDVTFGDCIDGNGKSTALQSISYHDLLVKSTSIREKINGSDYSPSSVNHSQQQQSPPPLIAILMNRGIGFVASILAIMDAGRGYVPVDPNFPPDRQSYILSNSKAAQLIIDIENLHFLESLDSETFGKDEDKSATPFLFKFEQVIVVCSRTGDVLAIVDHKGSRLVDTGLRSLEFIGKFIRINESFQSGINLSTEGLNDDNTFNNSSSRRSNSRSSSRSNNNNINNSKIAYVLYTSGSTGKPKGVIVYHGGVINTVRFFSRLLDVNGDDILLGITTFCFDISVLEIFLPLLNGAILVLISSRDQKNPRKIIDLLNYDYSSFKKQQAISITSSSNKINKNNNVSIFQGTPTTFDMLVAFGGWVVHDGLQLLVGGEEFKIKNLLDVIGKSKAMYNVYGPTETTIWSSFYKIPRDLSNKKSSTFSFLASSSSSVPVIPIGKPIESTIFYVADDSMNLLCYDACYLDQRYQSDDEAAGDIVGNLFIGGAGLGFYLDLAQANACYVPNPFNITNGKLTSSGITKTIYKTGDLVKRLKDGNYIFLSRTDSQVKVKGNRIELTEIESEVEATGKVRKCVVIQKKDSLFAFVILEQNASLHFVHESNSTCNYLGTTYVICYSFSKQVSEMLSAALPSYMIPKQFIIISKPNEFPVNSSGKTDKKVLSSVPILSQFDIDENMATDLPRDFDNASNRAIGSSDNFSNVLFKTKDTSHSVMTEFILHLIHHISGKHEKVSSSFSSIGIDSMNSIIFMNLISNAFNCNNPKDKFNVEYDEVYGVNVSVRSFAASIYSRLLRENPDALIKLNITSPYYQDHAASGCGSASNTSSSSNYCKDNSSSNHNILSLKSPLSSPNRGSRWKGDGVGGGPSSPPSSSPSPSSSYDSFSGEYLEDGFNRIDCSLDGSENEDDDQTFYVFFNNVISQKRRLLDGIRGILVCIVVIDHFFLSRLGVSSNRIRADNTMFVIITGFVLGLQQFAENYDTDGGKSKQIQPFSWKIFLISKAIGLFPMYFMALALTLPRQYILHPFYQFNSDTKLDGRPVNELIKIVFSYVFAVQNWTNYNRIILDVWYLSFLWGIFVVYAIVMVIFKNMSSSVIAKAILTIGLASVLAVINSAIRLEGYTTPLGCIYFALGFASSYVFGILMKYLFDSSLGDSGKIKVKDSVKASAGQRKNAPDFEIVNKRRLRLMSYAADCVGVFIVLLIFSDTFCSAFYFILFYSWLPPEYFDSVVEWGLIPVIFSLFLILSMALTNFHGPDKAISAENSKVNANSTSFIGAFCAYSNILQILGQCSLAIYVFQSVFVNFYVAFLVSGIHNLEFPFSREYALKHIEVNFTVKPVFQIIVGVALSIVFSVATQKLLIDRMAPYLHGVFLSKS